MGYSRYDAAARGRAAWNAGKTVGTKRPLTQKQIWAIRFFLDRDVSQHLQAMRRAGLVNSERDGKFVNYGLAGEDVLAAFAAIRKIAERHSAKLERVVRGWYDHHDDMEPVSRQELASRMKDGLVTVIDVRPTDEFALGRLPGAINVPLSELGSRLPDLHSGKEIVAYCRGPWCVMAFEAVAELRKRGFSARRLDGGLPEWQIAGMPLEHVQQGEQR